MRDASVHRFKEQDLRDQHKVQQHLFVGLLDQFMLYKPVFLRQSRVILYVSPQKLEVPSLSHIYQNVPDQNEGGDYIILYNPTEGLLILLF